MVDGGFWGPGNGDRSAAVVGVLCRVWVSSYGGYRCVGYS